MCGIEAIAKIQQVLALTSIFLGIVRQGQSMHIVTNGQAAPVLFWLHRLAESMA